MALFAPQYAQRAVFSRSFHISGTVGLIEGSSVRNRSELKFKFVFLPFGTTAYINFLLNTIMYLTR
jgi:hypothetical protein